MPRKRMISIAISFLLGTASISGAQQVASNTPAAPPSIYTPSTYPESYNGGFYPGTELRALPGARAQAVAARAIQRQAESSLNLAVEDLRLTFVTSHEWIEAQAEEREAFEQLNISRTRAMADLRQEDSYRAAVALRNQLADQIIGAHDNREPTETLVAMATVKLSYAVTASAMEAAAADADPRVETARRRLIAAGQRVSELKSQFDLQVRNNQQVVLARNTLAQVRINALASDALYLEANRVATAAMGYAYDLRSPSAYSVPFGYGYQLGYGGGYSLGYPMSWGR